MIASKEINDIVYRRDAFLSKTLIRKVVKTDQGNPGMSEPSFSINSHISRIQTQFYQALYRGLLIEGLVTRLGPKYLRQDYDWFVMINLQILVNKCWSTSFFDIDSLNRQC